MGLTDLPRRVEKPWGHEVWFSDGRTPESPER
jgi:hypothetical protein